MRSKSIFRILLINLPLIRNRIPFRQGICKGKIHRPGALRDAQHLALGLLSDDGHINECEGCRFRIVLDLTVVHRTANQYLIRVQTCGVNGQPACVVMGVKPYTALCFNGNEINRRCNLKRLRRSPFRHLLPCGTIVKTVLPPERAAERRIFTDADIEFRNAADRCKFIFGIRGKRHMIHDLDINFHHRNVSVHHIVNRTIICAVNLGRIPVAVFIRIFASRQRERQGVRATDLNFITPSFLLIPPCYCMRSFCVNRNLNGFSRIVGLNVEGFRRAYDVRAHIEQHDR